jgi:hypothetical protein
MQFGDGFCTQLSGVRQRDKWIYVPLSGHFCAMVNMPAIDGQLTKFLSHSRAVFHCTSGAANSVADTHFIALDARQ